MVVTIAIPVYNVRKYIARALESAFAQTFVSVEYLIIDDHGTDGSMEEVRRMMETHPRGRDIRIIDQGANLRTGAARNAAIDNAGGEYLFFMDGDDEITPNCIELLHAAIIESGADFAEASFERVDSEGRTIKRRIFPDVTISGGEHAVARAFYGGRAGFDAPVWNRLYDLDFLKRNNIRCIPNHIIEDVSFTHQLVLCASSCRLLSDVTYIYRIVEGSATQYHRNGIPVDIARQVVEICALKMEYMQRFAKCDFYPRLLETNYLYAMDRALEIWDSRLIARREKPGYINAILGFGALNAVGSKLSGILDAINSIRNIRIRMSVYRLCIHYPRHARIYIRNLKAQR